MSDYAVGDRIGTATVLAVRGTKVPSLDFVDKQKQPEAKPVTQPRGPRRPSAGERAYAEFLTMAQAAGIIQFWKPEPWFLPLADDAKYRPDFFVVAEAVISYVPEIALFLNLNIEVSCTVAVPSDKLQRIAENFRHSRPNYLGSAAAETPKQKKRKK